EPPFTEELPGRACRITAQLLGVERLRRLVRFDQPRPGTTVAFRLGSVPTDIRQLQSRTIRQPFDRLDEAEILDLHHELDDVATLATAETVERAVPGAHIERRCPLVVEGAQ